jgi:hypothetical protein
MVLYLYTTNIFSSRVIPFSLQLSFFLIREGANPGPTKQAYHTDTDIPRPMLYGWCRALPTEDIHMSI